MFIGVSEAMFECTRILESGIPGDKLQIPWELLDSILTELHVRREENYGEIQSYKYDIERLEILVEEVRDRAKKDRSAAKKRK